jgi:hypothetical protein
MKMLCLLCTVLLFFVNCNTKNSEAKKIEIEPETAQSLCFRNEYTFPDSTENIDVLELNLTILKDAVSGNYNWLPALKNQRNGFLNGTINENTVKATYHFMQEGVEQTTAITIVLRDDKAIITGDNPTSGLDTEVEKITCN